MSNMQKEKIKLLSNAPLDSDDYLSTARGIYTALLNDKNRSIGLIGDFGSGKSSAICSFIKMNKHSFRGRRKILRISLANFCAKYPFSKSLNNDNNKKILIESEEKYLKQLENDIIHQMLFSVRRWRIPSSTIRKHGIRIRTFALFLISLCFLISLIMSFLPNIFKIPNNYIFIPIIFSVLFGISFVFLLFLNFNFSSFKAKIKDVEFQADFLDKNYPLNFYLDEIVYFFSKTNFNLVIFEDIDRCPNCEFLFNELYTLNVIINSFPRCWFKKPIVFLYSIKEDLFEEAEQKSKFFDVLIPIKPVLTFTNARDRFVEALGNDEATLLGDSFVDLAALHFEYIRQINNVVNSYRLLSQSKLVSKKQELLSLLLYKSLYPVDYIHSIRQKGVLTYLMRNSGIGTPENFNGYECEAKKFSKIQKFYDDFNNFINLDSFELISSYPSNYSPDVKFYLTDLSKGKHIDYISQEFLIDECEYICNQKNYANYMSNDAIYNLCIIRFLYDQHSKNTTLGEKYDLFLNNALIKKETFNKFIKALLSSSTVHFEDSIDASILKDIMSKILISDIIHSLNNDLVGNFLKLITTTSIYDIQNQNDFVIKILNNYKYSVNFLSITNKPVYEKVAVSQQLCLRYLLIDGLNDLSRFIQIVSKKKFVVSDQNLKTIISVAEFKGNILNKMYDMNLSFDVIDYVFDNLDKFSLKDFVTTFDGTNDSIIIHLLKTICDNEYLFDLLIATKRSLSFDRNVDIPVAHINKLLEETIIQASIDVFSFFGLKINNNNKIAEYILTYDVLIDKKVETPDGLKLLNIICHNSKATFENIGSIFYKTVQSRSLSSTLISDCREVFKCALTYEYLVFDQTLINFIGNDEELFVLIMGNGYYEDIFSALTSYSFNLDQLYFLFNGAKNNEDKANLITINYSILENHISKLDKFKEFAHSIQSPNNEITRLMLKVASLTNVDDIKFLSENRLNIGVTLFESFFITKISDGENDMICSTESLLIRDYLKGSDKLKFIKHQNYIRISLKK